MVITTGAGYVFCSLEDVQTKVGANASTISNVTSHIQQYVEDIQAYINVYCRFNFNDAYSGLNQDVQALLRQVTTDLSAIYVINYDLSGFTAHEQIEDRINVLRDSAMRGLAVLREQANKDFINDAWLEEVPRTQE